MEKNLDDLIAQALQAAEEIEAARAAMAAAAQRRRELVVRIVAALGTAEAARRLGLTRQGVAHLLPPGTAARRRVEAALSGEHPAGGTGGAALLPLLQTARLQAGDELELRRRTGVERATVEADGRIRYRGETHDSPSAAARAATGATATDGWLRWRVVRLGGVQLAELREELRQRTSSS